MAQLLTEVEWLLQAEPPIVHLIEAGANVVLSVQHLVGAPVQVLVQ